jgi:acetyl-CoA/propionyl-CoA carboxylase biotin carboxyl carrier protein
MPGGSFVRLDTGLAEGRPVVGNYDSLFGKLIVWAEDRELCRRRMLRALDEIQVEGITTTIPFHRWALRTEEFRTGAVHTKFVEEAFAAGRFQAELAAADAAAGVAAGGSVAGGPAVAADGERPIRLTVEVDGRRIPVLLWGDHLPVPPKPPASASGFGAGDASNVTAPMQGTILQVMVQPGQQVASGDVVLILEAMKMENHIAASRDGVVKDVLVGKGDVVDSGTLLVSLE